jgi:hypothetical protein
MTILLSPHLDDVELVKPDTCRYFHPRSLRYPGLPATETDHGFQYSSPFQLISPGLRLVSLDGYQSLHIARYSVTVTV